MWFLRRGVRSLYWNKAWWWLHHHDIWACRYERSMLLLLFNYTGRRWSLFALLSKSYQLLCTAIRRISTKVFTQTLPWSLLACLLHAIFKRLRRDLKWQIDTKYIFLLLLRGNKLLYQGIETLLADYFCSNFDMIWKGYTSRVLFVILLHSILNFFEL